MSRARRQRRYRQRRTIRRETQPIDTLFKPISMAKILRESRTIDEAIRRARREMDRALALFGQAVIEVTAPGGSFDAAMSNLRAWKGDE